MGLKMRLSGEGQAALIKYGLLAAVLWFAYSKLKDLDLNPFDENGALGLSIPKNTLQIAGGDLSHKEALAKIGADITKYFIFYPNPLTGNKLPTGTLQVKWGGNLITYYAPKTGLEAFSL